MLKYVNKKKWVTLWTSQFKASIWENSLQIRESESKKSQSTMIFMRRVIITVVCMEVTIRPMDLIPI